MTAKQTDTHKVLHFLNDSGFSKFGVRPGGGGRAGSSSDEELILDAGDQATGFHCKSIMLPSH